MKKSGCSIIALLFVFFWVMTGCVTEKKCNRLNPPVIKQTTNTILKETHKDSIIRGADVTHVFYKDSLIQVNHWYSITDTAGISELKWYRDAYGNLYATCSAKDRLIKDAKTNQEKISQQLDTIVKNVNKMPWWGWVMFGLMGAVILFLLLKLLFKKI